VRVVLQAERCAAELAVRRQIDSIDYLRRGREMSVAMTHAVLVTSLTALL
jgi:hypothetical protein